MNSLHILFLSLLFYDIVRIRGVNDHHENNNPPLTITDFDSRIINVTIAGNSAMITRHLNIPLSSLQQQLQQTKEMYLNILSNLPNTAADNSIRVVGKGPCIILSHELQDKTVQRKDSQLYQQRNIQAMELKMEIDTKAIQIDNELNRLKAREKFLYVFMEASLSSKQQQQTFSPPIPTTTSATIAKNEESFSSDISKAKSLLQYMDTELISVHSSLSLAQRAQMQIEQCKEVINNVITDLSTKGIWSFPKLDCENFPHDDTSSSSLSSSTISNLPACRLHISLKDDDQEQFAENVAEKSLNIRVKLNDGVSWQNSGSNNLDFYISYMTSPASWYSEYDIQVTDAVVVSNNNNNDKDKTNSRRRLVIDYFASVSQRTGELWSDVKLALSTASASPIEEYPVPLEKAIYFQDAQGSVFTAADAVMYENVPPMMVPKPRTVAINGGRMRRKGNNDHSHLLKGGAEVEPQSMMMNAVSEDQESSPEPPDMVLASATTSMMSSPSSDLSAAYTFILPDNAYVRSNPLRNNVNTNHRQQRSKQRLFINKLEMEVNVFTYVAPSLDNKGFLRAIGQYPSTQPHSLVGSNNGVRIFISNSFSGTTNMETIQPGQDIKLNLGKDNHLVISDKKKLPHSQGKEENQGWLFSDKKKYHVKEEEYTFNVRSTHNTSHLVIVTENLPKSSDKDITVELMSPDKSNLISIHVDKANDHEQCVSFLLREVSFSPSNVVPTSPTHVYKTFHCIASSSILWAQWMRRGDSTDVLSSSLKYKLIWPEGKNIFES